MSKTYGRVDVLLVAPMDEEAYACRIWLSPKSKGAKAKATFVEHDGLEIYSQFGLEIALLCLGGQGNVEAAVRTARALDSVGPRLVLLVGIAAGHPDKFRVGDVGVHTLVYYYAIGKQRKGKRFPEIRSWKSLAIGQAQIVHEHFPPETEWRGLARKWFLEQTSGAGLWATEFSKKDFAAIKQASNDDAHAEPAALASGELVVGDAALQKHIRKSYAGAQIQLFEMEAYGVARACKDRGDVVFQSIRGVSDDGTPDKGDQYRLWATVVASAFTRCLLSQPAMSQAIRKVVPNDVSPKCIHPLVDMKCEYEHRCVGTLREEVCDHGMGTELLLSRAYESVTPANYSRSLARRVEASSADGSFTFLFPYTPIELLTFIGVHVDGARPYVDAILNDYASDRDQLKGASLERFGELLRMAAREARHIFEHFRVCEAWLNKLSITDPWDRAARMSRVLALPRDSFPSIDPLDALIGLVLGTGIPTFLIPREEFEVRSAHVDDITFVMACLETFDAVERDDWLTSLQFIADSQILLVAGWPCAWTRLGRSDNGPRKLSLTLWREWLMNRDPYQPLDLQAIENGLLKRNAGAVE